jgi:nucleoside-diphosphate-sugar epimerase
LGSTASLPSLSDVRANPRSPLLKTAWNETPSAPDQRDNEEQPIRNVLVVGGAGFVGSVLIPKLLDRGYRVRVMDSLMYGDDGIRHLTGRPGFELVEGDLRSLEAMVRSSRDADALIHLGALVGDPACALDENLTLEINLKATRNLAEVARGIGVRRFIFASTCSVYGATDELLDEGSALGPVSLYARSKMESEQLTLALDNHEFSTVALRFGTFYGLSPRPRFDLIVNMLAAKAMYEKEITIFGGDQWRPFVHVDDGADAIAKCLEAPADVIKGQIFNVGSDDQNYTLRQVAGEISRIVPGVRVVYDEKAAQEANYRVSFAKISRELNFRPRITLEGGIREICAAIEAGEVSDYLDARYSNIKSLTTGNGGQLLQRSAL